MTMVSKAATVAGAVVLVLAMSVSAFGQGGRQRPRGFTEAGNGETSTRIGSSAVLARTPSIIWGFR